MLSLMRADSDDFQLIGAAKAECAYKETRV